MEGDEFMSSDYSDAAFGILIKNLFGGINENGTTEYGKGDDAFARSIMEYALMPHCITRVSGAGVHPI